MSSLVMFRGVAIVILCSLRLLAQTVNGSINGTVADETGSVIPSVMVEAKNEATGLRRTAEGTGIGVFSVPLLPPGFYTVTVSKLGFAARSRAGVQLLVNQNLTLDFTLSPSEVQQTVEVSAAPPQLETTTGTLGKVLQSEQIVDLPLNGRMFTQLVLLTPGAAPRQTSQQGAFTVSQGAGGISPAVNGQRGQQNNFTMDGILNNAIFTNTWAISPPPDAIQEFNTQSHIVDAQFTISSGANINLVTRSGSNQLHGALWEFFRHDKLDARNFFDARKPPYRQNQYGITAGGPVLLPGYDGRKKNTWVFAYWEGFRSRRGRSIFASVPTAAMREGNFSAFLGPVIGTDSLGRPIARGQLYDPLTTREDPASPGSFVRDPFPGNRIERTRFNNSSLLTLQKYYPLPNLPVADNVFPNLQFQRSIETNNDQFGTRLDHRFSNNDTLFGRFSYTRPEQIRPQGLPTYSQSLQNDARSLGLGYTHLFGPRTLLTVSYGYIYTNFGQYDDPAGEEFLKATRSDRLFPVRNNIPLAAQIGVSEDFTGVSQSAFPLGPQQNHHWNADLSVVRGNHTMGFGFMHYRMHNFDDGQSMSLAFSRFGTAIETFGGQTGLGAASFLLGLPDSLNGAVGDTYADFKGRWYGGYLQDKWQVTKRLTLHFGLRYDFVGPPRWKNNKVSSLDIDTGQFLIPVAYPPLFPTATVRETLFDPRYNGFQPRFGIAYRAQEKTVVRGAFTIFNDQNNPWVQQTQSPRIAWPWALGIVVPGLNRRAPTTYFDNLPLASSFFDPLQPRVAFVADPRNKLTYSMQFNFGVQRQITPSLAGEVNYVGALGRHVSVGTLANTARFPAPGPIASRQPFPQYGGALGTRFNRGTTSYNSLQAKADHRFSRGLTFLASYTYSKSLDIHSEGVAGAIMTIYDMKRDWGPSDYDFKHMFVFSNAYSLPVGKGKTFLSSGGQISNAIVGGWNVGSIISLLSGAPFSILAGGDIANVGGGAQRAQNISDPETGFEQSRLKWFNTAAFRTPVPFTFGNSGRNNLRGPRQFTLDLVASKDFVFTETKKLQFRAEFFNLPNHTRLGLPNNNVQSAAFGGIFSAGEPRDIQFGLKFIY